MIRVILCFLAMIGGVYAQNADGALKAARELSGAVKTGDMMWMVERMHPRVKKKLAGGEKELVRQVREVQEQMKSNGVSIELFEVSPGVGEFWVNNPINLDESAGNVNWNEKSGTDVAGEEAQNKAGYVASPQLLVVLPTRTIVRQKLASGQVVRVEQKSYLLAVAYAAAPNKWYFISPGSFNVNDLKFLFYDLPTAPFLECLPPVSEKVLN